MPNRITGFYNGRLAQFTHKADTRSAWEEQWRLADLELLYQSADAGAFGVYHKSFREYLPQKGLIVEAGCGTGRYVRALTRVHGYSVIGLEWADQTLMRVKQIWPDAPVICGDVRTFPFPSQTISAVISLGVIEHFEDPWAVLQDSARILQPNGLLYLVVPYANPFRKLRAKHGKYLNLGDSVEFYQYLLSDVEIHTELQNLGFSIETYFATGSFAGLADEFPALVEGIEKLPFSHRIMNTLNKSRLLGSICGHVVHYIARKIV